MKEILSASEESHGAVSGESSLKESIVLKVKNILGKVLRHLSTNYD